MGQKASTQKNTDTDRIETMLCDTYKNTDIDFTIKADSIKIKYCVIYNTVIKKNTRKKTESTEKYIESKTELNITDSIAQIKTDSISEINIKSKTTPPSNSCYKIFIYSFLIFVLFIFIIRWLRKHNIL